MYILYNRLITAFNEKKPDSTEFYIAKMMIWNLWELPRMSISDVAKMCAVSKSTISKFVRDIGFEDYLDFKLEAVRQGKKEIYNSNGKCNITDYIRGHGIWEYEKILSEDIRSVLFGIEEDQDVYKRQKRGSERFKDKPDKDDWDHHSGAEQHFLCRDYYRSGRCASKSWICNDDL